MIVFNSVNPILCSKIQKLILNCEIVFLILNINANLIVTALALSIGVYIILSKAFIFLCKGNNN